ncbi:dihydrodipicolinate reductase [Legionella geestiana]|uniref:4-hydroxy-tetrahydrodipicolinate reductase n=1 Tax=Legionella geestiana TaxID=45065 RepID=A0A0W0TP05_9GAMM|nr:4-hydroxy-tetrahydrodipicolinate reductase [Legionella geestiana]KTC97331.1 dihydrodipicolinate reductase [Legionella geestiana]QBS12456.1 4-hydroxy-tetrahydrodipicolinate reductase [Legionella geestiana]QDQ39829.1 4-hydroxy-tetrahydrodipicolinate reductase [Legionella geestiana]STX55101.1 dihydrodipicolinate reductase [Legionella geestiana]
MPVRVIINGARGKMGVLACAAIEAHAPLELVARLGREDNLKDAIQNTKAEVVLDLTRADCAFDNARTIINAGARPVIGTSGLVETDVQTLREMCEARGLGGLIVPNFSIAAVLMMRFAAEAARWLNHAEIIEAHHPQKLDAPSGTALATAAMMAKTRQSPPETLQLREIIAGARGGSCHDIPIHSVRLPGILARQEVLFGAPGETLSITHNTLDRNCYMKGVVLACEKAPTLKTLCQGLEHVLQS